MSPLLQLAMRVAKEAFVSTALCEIPDPTSLSPDFDVEFMDAYFGGVVYAFLLELGYTDEDALHWLAQESAT